MAHLHEEVAARVAESVRAAEAPTVLSGDCMVALGTIAGVRRAGVDASVVWFDAHGDLQTLETTTSGYMGGIPLRSLWAGLPLPVTFGGGDHVLEALGDVAQGSSVLDHTAGQGRVAPSVRRYPRRWW